MTMIISRFQRFAWLGLLLLLAGCGLPDNLIVLLDNPDGSVGKIEVSAPRGTRLLDQPLQATGFSAPGRTPADVFAVTRQDVEENFAGALRAQPKLPDNYILYFETGGTTLTRESQARLPAILQSIKERPAPDLAVVGHTDTVGSDRVNVPLSLARAVVVRDLLVQIGVSSAMIEVSSHGKNNLLVPTPDQTPEPRNRRVEVTVR